MQVRRGATKNSSEQTEEEISAEFRNLPQPSLHGGTLSVWNDVKHIIEAPEMSGFTSLRILCNVTVFVRPCFSTDQTS